MLSSLHIAVLGGDDRYVHVITQLLNQGAKITAVGYPTVLFNNKNITCSTIEHVDFERVDALLLPVAGMDAEGNIQSFDKMETFKLTKSMLQKTPSTCTIFTGTANDWLRNLVKETSREMIVLFERDDIAIANSIPTAEATLQIAMEETTETIHNTNVLIIGYGRVGKTMAHLFHQVGANVSVAARKDYDLAEITMKKYHAINIKNIHDQLSNQQIIINTVPAIVLGENELEKVTTNCLVIDVASKPGGTDFSKGEQLGIHTIHALGLPGKFAPTTAGNIIANVLTTLLQRKL